VANKVHVKKGDTVLVLSGKDSGKKGKVLGVNPGDSTVLVEGVNMVTKHVKPKGRYQQGGLVHQEGTINSAKVMLVCERCGKPTKIAKSIQDNGEKSRICKKCGEVIDVVKEAKSDK
jgi:large subunit ribosomal protein L24